MQKFFWIDYNIMFDNNDNTKVYLQLLHEVTVEANQSETIEQALRFGMGQICDALGWEVGHLCSYHNEIMPLPTNLWHIRSGIDEDEFRPFIESTELCGEEGISSHVIKVQESLWVEDVNLWSKLKPYMKNAEQIRTAAAVPVWVGSEITAVMEFYTTQMRPKDNDEVKVMEDIGIQLGRVVERHQAYQILRNSERKFRSVFEEAGVGMVLIDKEFKLIHCNNALQRMLDYSEKELIERQLHELCHPKDAIQFQEFSHRLFQPGDSTFTAEKRFQRSDGNEMWGKVTISYILSDDMCEFAYAILVIEDISGEKRMQEEKRKLQQELSNLTVYEQRRIGQDLHDSVGQEITGLGFLANKMAKLIQKQTLPKVEDAQNLVKGLQKTLNNIREIVYGLIPIEMNGDELFSALDDLARNIQQYYAIECVFQSDQTLSLKNKQKVLQVYRIVQEAVNNAVKHAKPSQIQIVHRQYEDKIEFSIHDNGSGLNEEAGNGGLGIKIMRYRAEIIGAEMSIFTNSKGGTTVRLLMSSGEQDLE